MISAPRSAGLKNTGRLVFHDSPPGLTGAVRQPAGHAYLAAPVPAGTQLGASGDTPMAARTAVGKDLSVRCVEEVDDWQVAPGALPTRPVLLRAPAFKPLHALTHRLMAFRWPAQHVGLSLPQRPHVRAPAASTPPKVTRPQIDALAATRSYLFEFADIYENAGKIDLAGRWRDAFSNGTWGALGRAEGIAQIFTTSALWACTRGGFCADPRRHVTPWQAHTGGGARNRYALISICAAPSLAYREVRTKLACAQVSGLAPAQQLVRQALIARLRQGKGAPSICEDANGSAPKPAGAVIDEILRAIQPGGAPSAPADREASHTLRSVFEGSRVSLANDEIVRADILFAAAWALLEQQLQCLTSVAGQAIDLAYTFDMPGLYEPELGDDTRLWCVLQCAALWSMAAYRDSPAHRLRALYADDACFDAPNHKVLTALSRAWARLQPLATLHRIDELTAALCSKGQTPCLPQDAAVVWHAPMWPGRCSFIRDNAQDSVAGAMAHYSDIVEHLEREALTRWL